MPRGKLFNVTVNVTGLLASVGVIASRSVLAWPLARLPTVSTMATLACTFRWLATMPMASARTTRAAS